LSLADTIKAEEGWRAFVYDDATGQPILKGSTVQGYPTIGYGFCLEAIKGTPLPQEIGERWLELLIAEKREELEKRWLPFSTQPSDVQDALTEMAYQLGVGGVLGFRLMLQALERGDRVTAAVEVLDSEWHKDTPARCERVAAMIRGS